MTTIPIDEMITKECSREDFSKLSLSDLRLAHDLYTIAIDALDKKIASQPIDLIDLEIKIRVVDRLKSAVINEIINRI